MISNKKSLFLSGADFFIILEKVFKPKSVFLQIHFFESKSDD